MSKKKQSVMEKERANFIYGNPEENVPGCIANGIDEQTAGQIYDMMMDFAKYAFNKSHAACYAVVAYQTAYLKYYYPVEFMAALMTSVIDNPKKVSEYILNCRNMDIAILPPDVNAGEAGFSVSDGKIRYALTAIKSVGRPIIDSLVQERKERGPFTNLKDFITRMSDKKEMNKRAIENLIKAGALDGLGGTRKQFMSVYVQIADHIAHDKKNNLAGQISLFDIAGEEDKEEFDIRCRSPDCSFYHRQYLVRDLHIDTHELFSRTAQTIQSSCFDQVLNSPLIHLFFIGHAGNKVLQIRERASFLTLLYQAVNDGTSHTLDGRQGITDLAIRYGESGFSRIHIRRQNGNIHVPAIQNIFGYLFRVIDDGSHQRRHEFYGIIVFQIRCLVSHHCITCRMGLVERIFGEIHHHIVDICRLVCSSYAVWQYSRGHFPPGLP